MKKPEPKAVKVECSVCGLDWEKHQPSTRKSPPTLEDCVRLLKAALAEAKQNRAIWSLGSSAAGNYSGYTITEARGIPLN